MATKLKDQKLKQAVISTYSMEDGPQEDANSNSLQGQTASAEGRELNETLLVKLRFLKFNIFALIAQILVLTTLIFLHSTQG